MHPLVTHTSPEAPLAWRNGREVSVAQFLQDVESLTNRFPAGKHVLNVCRDRYRFAVGFAAALVSGRTSLLPPTHTPETVRQMQAYAPDVFFLHDQPECDIDLPRLHYMDAGTAPSSSQPIPTIPAERHTDGESNNRPATTSAPARSLVSNWLKAATAWLPC